MDSTDLIGFGGDAPANEIAEDVRNSRELIAFSTEIAHNLNLDGDKPREFHAWVTGVENLIARAQRDA